MRFSLRQLEFMRKASVYMPKSPDYNYGNQAVFYAAKERFRELLLQRMTGTDSLFGWSLADGRRLFASPKDEPDQEGFSCDGMWAMCDDVDSCDLGLANGDVSLSWVFWAITTFTGLFGSGDMHIVLPDKYRKKDGRPTTEFITRALMDEERMLWGEEEENEETFELLADFLISVDMAADGFFEEAMDNDIFYQLVEGINSNMGDRYPAEFIIRNLDTFLTPYVFSSSEDKISCTAFSSSEVYWYSKYRDYLPVSERALIDMAIELYDMPMGPDADDCIAEDIEEKCSHEIVLVLDEQYGSTLEDVFMFWKDVRDFLAETLPELRKKYMPMASGSPSGEPASFFCVQKVAIMWLSVVR